MLPISFNKLKAFVIACSSVNVFGLRTLLVRPLHLVTPDDTVVPCAFERVLDDPKEVSTEDSS